MTDTTPDRTCFGCQKQILSFEPHIHVGMDEFASREGIAALGMDDLLTFAMCEACTQETGHGWTPEAHLVRRTA